MSEVTQSPVDPKSAPNYRFMMAIVIGLGVLILAGVIVLFVGLARGWGSHAAPEPAQAPKKPVSMSLEPGYHILSSDSQPGRLILHVRSETVDEIFVIDTNDGHIVAVVTGEAPKQ